MKDFLIKLGIDKAGPSAIRGGILGAVGWLAIHNNVIPGIHTDAAAHTTLIQWDLVQTWAIAGLPALTAAVIKLFQVHGTTAVKSIAAATPPQGDPK